MHPSQSSQPRSIYTQRQAVLSQLTDWDREQARALLRKGRAMGNTLDLVRRRKLMEDLPR